VLADGTPLKQMDHYSASRQYGSFPLKYQTSLAQEGGGGGGKKKHPKKKTLKKKHTSLFLFF